MSDTNSLISEVQAFCARHGIAESTFGQYATEDTRLVARLKSGRVTLRTVNKIRRHLEEDGAHLFKTLRRPRQKYGLRIDRPLQRKELDDDQIALAIRLITGALCPKFDIDTTDLLRAPGQQIFTVRGRQITAGRLRARIAYLANTSLGVSQSRIAALMGVTKQAISKSLPLVEDEMDDPEIARVMDSMDRLLRPDAEARHDRS